MSNQLKAQKATEALIELSATDTDKVSCLSLGLDWAEAEGTVFIVKDAEVAEAMYKMLRNLGLITNRPVLARKSAR